MIKHPKTAKNSTFAERVCVNPAVTEDENTKNPIPQKPLTSAKRVSYQNFRYNDTYPTALEPKP